MAKQLERLRAVRFDIWTRTSEVIGPSMWAGLTTATKAIAHLIILKYVAVAFGPSTLGIVGQTMSLVAILQNFAGGGISNGVIRNFSFNFSDTAERGDFISRSFSSGLVFCAFSLIVASTIPGYLSEQIFGSPDYSWVFVASGILSLFAFIGSFCQSLLTARGSVKQIFVAQVCGWMASLPLIIYLSINYSTRGMISGILLTIAAQASFMLATVMRQEWFATIRLRFQIHSETARALLPFTFIALVSGLLSPLIFIILRSHIVTVLSWEYVGYWQALLKISEVCFSFISLVIASTFFPRVSKIIDGKEALRETGHFILTLLPFLVLLFGALMALGHFVLEIVFAKEFGILEHNMRVMLLGDMFRAIGWILSYLLLARNHLKVFIIIEISTSALLYLMCAFGIQYGFDQMIIMQMLHSILHCLALVLVTLTLRKIGKL